MQTRRSKPRGCVKHVRAVSCVSIKADKCSVQLMSSQIATMRDRGAPRSGAAGRPGCGEGQSGAGGPRSGSVGAGMGPGPQLPSAPQPPMRTLHATPQSAAQKSRLNMAFREARPFPRTIRSWEAWDGNGKSWREGARGKETRKKKARKETQGH